ncbi:MerR family transcriptional regulator [Methylocella tundrae]|uniref:MerR family transcriptional regulator n=1 Tax=Methylocella tundrae TaxID=227605 RepID=UPI0024529154|nr:MerR family transcriptional regulator [Methylocella tundrae]WPP03919.1 MerR family transcriptional regulator [Methylocella tundrae]
MPISLAPALGAGRIRRFVRERTVRLANSGPYLRSAEVARRLGVSGKALRLYEAHGLLRAERTPAGWRVYGPDQIARLHQVIALKNFGFPLSRIAELLSGGLPDLATFLELHEQVLRQEAKRVDQALRLLSAARAKLAEHGSISSDDLMNLTKETAMTNKRNDDLAAAYRAVAAKHFSPSDQATLAANGYGGMDKADADWEALHGEATRLMKSGDPSSPEAMDLARRWMGKVFEATGGDPALTRKMRTVARETHEQPAFAAASSSSNDIMDFVGQAYGAAIAEGIMPKPDDAA